MVLDFTSVTCLCSFCHRNTIGSHCNAYHFSSCCSWSFYFVMWTFLPFWWHSFPPVGNTDCIRSVALRSKIDDFSSDFSLSWVFEDHERTLMMLVSGYLESETRLGSPSCRGLFLTACCSDGRDIPWSKCHVWEYNGIVCSELKPDTAFLGLTARTHGCE
jgi:hypothetical protein